MKLEAEALEHAEKEANEELTTMSRKRAKK